MRAILLQVVFIFLSFGWVQAQSDSCFYKFLRNADHALKAMKYGKALEFVGLAEKCSDAKRDETSKYLNRILSEIKNQKKETEIARDKAVMAERAANEAAKRARRAKEGADLALKLARQSNNNMTEALRLAEIADIESKKANRARVKTDIASLRLLLLLHEDEPTGLDSIADFSRRYQKINESLSESALAKDKDLLESILELKGKVETEFLKHLEWATEFPKPSAFYTVPEKKFLQKTRQADPNMTLYDVKEVIQQCLYDCGYYGLLYGKIDSGFVVITPIEQLDENAFPLSGKDRWNSNAPVVKIKSLNEYLKNLIFPVKGYYRMLMLTVANKPVNFNPNETKKEAALSMRARAATSLDSATANKAFSKGYVCTVMTFEFESNGSNPSKPSESPIANIREQLKNNSLLPHLETNH